MSSIAEKPASAKPAKAANAKQPKAKSSLPPTSVIVQAAIGALKERKGSSLVAIKKYIATNYKVDPVKHSHFIKKALTNGVEKKILLRVKGVGASGSFKLAKVEKVKPKKKAVKPKKVKTPGKPKKKKTTKPKPSKKATKKAEKPKKSAKKSAKPKKPVAKKASKAPAKKPAKKAAPKKK